MFDIQLIVYLYSDKDIVCSINFPWQLLAEYKMLCMYTLKCLDIGSISLYLAIIYLDVLKQSMLDYFLPHGLHIILIYISIQ